MSTANEPFAERRHLDESLCECLEVQRRGAGRAADERKVPVDDLRVDDVAELGEPAVRTVVQLHRIERLWRVQLRA